MAPNIVLCRPERKNILISKRGQKKKKKIFFPFFAASLNVCSFQGNASFNQALHWKICRREDNNKNNKNNNKSEKTDKYLDLARELKKKQN